MISNAVCRFADSTPAFASSPWTCKRILTISKGFVKIYLRRIIYGDVRLDNPLLYHQQVIPIDMLMNHQTFSVPSLVLNR
jgi:hypothetical protein